MNLNETKDKSMHLHGENRSLEAIFTVPEAAEITRLSLSWWRKKIMDKKIRHLKVGGRVLIPQSAIQELFENSVVEPVGK
jgi:excisionase family DNA binding protein